MPSRRVSSGRRGASRGVSAICRHRVVIVSTVALLLAYVGLINRPPRELVEGAFDDDTTDASSPKSSSSSWWRREEEGDGEVDAGRAAADDASLPRGSAEVPAIYRRATSEGNGRGDDGFKWGRVDLHAPVRGCGRSSAHGAYNAVNTIDQATKTSSSSSSSGASAATKRVASSATTGGCVADGRVYPRGDASRGPWTALLPVPGAEVVACTDCRAFAGLSRRRTPRECRKVLTWCPEAESHAASLLLIRRDGALLAAWFQGHEGMSDVSIAVSRLALERAASVAPVWAAPQLVSSAHSRSAQNPILFQVNRLGVRVYLLHTSHLQEAGQGSSEIHRLTSDDGGVTWSAPSKVKALGLDARGMFLRAPPLVLPFPEITKKDQKHKAQRGEGEEGEEDAAAEGEEEGVRVLLPVYHTPGGSKTHFSAMLEYVVTPSEMEAERVSESRSGGDEGGVSDVMFSERGKGWIAHVMSRAGEGLVQPTVVRVRPPSPLAAAGGGGGVAAGRRPETFVLLAIFRHRFEPHLYMSVSSDGGVTWSAPRRSSLPSNNSGVQALALSSGALLLAFNNVAAGDALAGSGDAGGGGGGGRNRSSSPPRDVLTLAISDDAGDTWSHVRDLEPGGRDDPAFGRVPDRDERRRTLASGGLRYSYPAVAQDPVSGHIHVAYTFNREAIKHAVVTEGWVRAKGGSTAGHFSPAA